MTSRRSDCTVASAIGWPVSGSVMRKDDTWTGMPSPVGQCRSVVSPVHRPSRITAGCSTSTLATSPSGVRKSAIDVVVTSTSSGTPASRRPPGLT